MKRVIHLARLKPECVDEYVRQHQNVPTDVLAAYRKAGITKVSCFLNGCDLIVFSEYDENKYPASRVELEANRAEIAWQKAMATLKDETCTPREFTEVFHMD